MSNILPDGKEIMSEPGYQLRYYPDGQFTGHVVGWTQRYNNGQPLEEWEPTNFGSPFRAIESYPGLRKKLLQAAAGEL